MPLTAKQSLALWQRALLPYVRNQSPDLSARQMVLLLSVYVEGGPHTVRGLAARLSISKPAVTRAIDALEKLEFVRRMPDESDKRSILVSRTVKGAVFLDKFGALISAAAEQLSPA